MTGLFGPSPPYDASSDAARVMAVVTCLRQIKVQRADLTERDIEDAACMELLKSGIGLRRQYVLGPGERVDILAGPVGAAVVVEVKKGRPPAAGVAAQLGRYLAHGGVVGAVLLLERQLDLPRTIGGKPVIIVSTKAVAK